MQKMKFTLPKLDECNAENYAENLREVGSGADKALMPVGAPEVVTDDAGVLTFELPGGDLLMADSDCQQLSVAAATPQAPVRSVGCLSAVLRSVMALSATEVVLLTEAGPEWLTRANEQSAWTLRGAVPSAPTVRFTAEATETVEAYVEPFTLSGSYSRGSGALTAADCAAAAGPLLAAYNNMVCSAAAKGLKLQPVLMMWRMKDAAGRVLRQGVPQWVAAPAGFSCLNSVELNVTKGDDGVSFNQVGGAYVTAQAYGVTVELGGAGNLTDFWREKIASLELLMSPDLDFTALTSAASGRMDLVDSSSAVATLHLPGAAEAETLRSMVIDALARFHSTARVVATVVSPFASGAAESVALNLPQVSSSTSAAITVADRTLAQLSMPHSFAADVTYGSGAAMILGNIRSVPAPVMLPADYAAGLSGSTATKQFSVARMADGRTRAAMSSTRAGAATLPPLIVFPSVDAVQLQLHVGGKAQTLALTPSACGRYSYYLAEKLADFSTATWSADEWHTVSGTDSGTEWPNLLLTAAAASPLTPVAAQVVCRDALMRLTPSLGATGGWNYGRQHLMAWATDGVYAVSIDRTLATVASTLLHSPGVERSDAVALATRCTYAVGADGVLLRWQGSNATALTLPASSAAAVAAMWCRATEELWVAHEDGAVTVLTANCARCYRRTDLSGGVARFVGEYAVDGSGALLMPARERTATAVEVTWRRRVALAQWPQRCVATWLLDAAAARLTLSLLRDGGGAPQRLLELRVDGPINAPIRAALRSPRRPYVTALISGALTAPARLAALDIAP
jgi:hypothetical protein